MEKPHLRNTASSLLMIILAFLLISALTAGLTGCGDKEETDAQKQGLNEYEEAEDTTEVDESSEDSYIESQIGLELNLDLLFEKSPWGKTDQGIYYLQYPEEQQAGADKIEALASKHGCIVAEYKFGVQSPSATAVIVLPAGKDADEAIAEFLEEPLVVDAYRL